MRILITENQLRLLRESSYLKPMTNEVFQKYFVFVFNRLGRRFKYVPISFDEYLDEIKKYDSGYLQNSVFHIIFNRNVKPNINWGSDKLDVVFTIEVDNNVINLPNNLNLMSGLIIKNNLIEFLPDNLTVKGEIDVRRSNLKNLGNNLKVNVLDMSNTSISEIPNNLQVKTLIISNTFFSERYTEDELSKLIKEKGGSVGRILGALKDKAIWRPNNILSTYTFGRNTSDSLANKFTDYIKSQNKENKPATRRDFLEKMGYKFDRGFLSTFFASIKNAGIVTMDRKNEYYLGPNYEKYKEGKIERKKKY
jgi:hypothetical protein